MSTKIRDLVKALALGYSDTAKLMMEDVEEGSQSDMFTATFCVCVEQRFKEDSSESAVRAFVDQAKRNYAGANFKALTAEALIRVVLDPDANSTVLEEVSSENYISAQIPVIRKIVAESVELTERIETVLDDAEKMIAAWDAED